MFLTWLIAFTSPRPLDRKCAPVQWERFAVGTVTQVFRGSFITFDYTGYYAHDFLNKVMSIRSQVKIWGAVYESTTITDFNKVRE